MAESHESRETLANEMAEYCHELGLDDSYGISITKRKPPNKRSYWSVLFCRARTLDGEVRIYGAGFIQIRFQTAIRSLPHKHSEIFKSPLMAKQALTDWFGSKT